MLVDTSSRTSGSSAKQKDCNGSNFPRCSITQYTCLRTGAHPITQCDTWKSRCTPGMCGGSNRTSSESLTTTVRSADEMATSFTVTGLYQTGQQNVIHFRPAGLICLCLSCRLTTRRGCLSCQRGMVHFASMLRRDSGKTCVKVKCIMSPSSARAPCRPPPLRRTSESIVKTAGI